MDVFYRLHSGNRLLKSAVPTADGSRPQVGERFALDNLCNRALIWRDITHVDEVTYDSPGATRHTKMERRDDGWVIEWTAKTHPFREIGSRRGKRALYLEPDGSVYHRSATCPRLVAAELVDSKEVGKAAPCPKCR